MGGLSEAVSTPVVVELNTLGYATFYHSEKSYALPEGLKAYIVTEGSQDQLAYKSLSDAIPAGTAVMLKGNDRYGRKFELKETKAEAIPAGRNLLVGSDVSTMTFSLVKMPCLFYKLAFGHSNTPNAKVLGWYWGAENGEAFEIEGHRAWLAIPKTAANARMYPIIIDEEATGIDQLTLDSNATDEIYNLNGQRLRAGDRRSGMRVDTPAKGLYIRNHKKVIIK
jgi:hypothetical protein